MRPRGIPWRLLGVVSMVLALIVVAALDRQAPRREPDPASLIRPSPSTPTSTSSSTAPATSPGWTADRLGAERVGLTWVRTYVTASTADPASWRRRLARLSTPRLARQAATTQASLVPATSVGHDAVRLLSAELGQVSVRLANGWTLIVAVVRRDGRWLASSVQVNTL